jgi:hypothetical protein
MAFWKAAAFEPAFSALAEDPCCCSVKPRSCWSSSPTAANYFGLMQGSSKRKNSILDRSTGARHDPPYRAANNLKTQHTTAAEGERYMSDQRDAGHNVEIITDQNRVKEVEPLITVRTGLTEGKTFVVRINQPAGRALLVAVHL